MPPKKKPKVQRGGMMITPHHYQMGPYANVQTGEGWLSDAWDGVKSVGKKAFDFVKDNKLISTGLAMTGDPRAKVASGFASQLGFEKKRKNVLKF